MFLAKIPRFLGNMGFDSRLGHYFQLLSITLLLLFHESIAVTEKSLHSHRNYNLSHIPWNMLLDPNYMSHKKYKVQLTTQHPHHSYQGVKEPKTTSFNHYVPSRFTPSYVTPPNTFSLSTHESKPARNDMAGAYGNQFSSNHPPGRVTFPSQDDHNDRFNTFHDRPEPSIKNSSKRKNNVRKPEEDYFDSGDDYMDNFYDDYDYTLPEKNRYSYKPPKKHTRPSYPKKDPLAHLPSESESFFTKAKDLLKGASFGRPSYAPTSEYYSHYPPPKNYEDQDHSYYSEDGYGYPPKSYFGTSGYDYETIGDKFSEGYPFPDKRKGTKYGPLAFALGLLPLGLLLASLVPTVVTIPVSTAVATGRRRKRDLRLVNPALEIISSYGMLALEDPICLNRIFCEVVRNGQQKTSSVVQKFYFKFAYLLDEKIADFVGLKELLIAVKKNDCQHFTCPAKSTFIPSAKNSTVIT